MFLTYWKSYSSYEQEESQRAKSGVFHFTPLVRGDSTIVQHHVHKHYPTVFLGPVSSVFLRHFVFDFKTWRTTELRMFDVALASTGAKIAIATSYDENHPPENIIDG